MQKRLIERKLPALVITILGISAIVASLQYEIGTLNEMGPGYYPLLLGVALFAIGLFLLPGSGETLESVVREAAQDAPAVPTTRRKNAPLYIIAGLASFILLGKYGGLVPATFALVAFSALADTKNTPKNIFLLAAATSVACGLIFNLMIDIQFPLFRWG
ncbi:tripartite tricarboxylate transporter TctB family protein [Melaminivora sp.]|uniref:tripartite tricarboxylate transporter TctB family protein n=1 Tax=Melaminivora sp. TaxID=1933032 RepID=UPI0028A7B627|nr:tripartite tricarboxylate transporter TctB family protein [Melaminivora sp.]